MRERDMVIGTGIVENSRPIELPCPALPGEQLHESSSHHDSVAFSGDDPKVKEWTLLFYNAGYGSESKMCTSTLVDLEKVGSDENTNVVVMNYRTPWFLEKITGQHRSFNGARTYYVTKNTAASASKMLKYLPMETRNLARFLESGPSDITSPVIKYHPEDINMGDGETLKNFLIENMKKYPAKHYGVILSGHGAAFGGSMIVHKPEGRIKNEQLAQVFRDVARETGRPIEFVDMNTCFSANLESLYPLKDCASTVVASESVVFAATQPFSRALADLQQGIKEGRDIHSKELAGLVIEESRRQPLGNLYTETLSAIDMKKLAPVADAVKNLQKAIIENVEPERVREAYQKCLKIDYSSIPRQIYVTDIGSFADEISRCTDSALVHETAKNLKKAIGECVIDEQHALPAKESLTSRLFHLLTGKQKDWSNLSGISIYYDDDANHPDSRLDQIQKTEYAANSNTEEFLKYLSRASEEEKALRSPLKKGMDGLKEMHAQSLQYLSRKTGVHQGIVSFAEHGMVSAAMWLTFRACAGAGIPLYPLIFGTLLGSKGVLNIFSGIKGCTETVPTADKGVKEKEAVIEHVSKAAMGVAMGAFGLYLLKILPPSAAWPAAIAAIAIRGGKMIANALVHRQERMGFREEVNRFTRMSGAEKLDQLCLQNKF